MNLEVADLVPSQESPLLPSCSGEGWVSLFSGSSEEERLWRMEVQTGSALLMLLGMKSVQNSSPLGKLEKRWRSMETTGQQPQVGLRVSFPLLFSAEPQQDSSTWDEQSISDSRGVNFRVGDAKK